MGRSGWPSGSTRWLGVAAAAVLIVGGLPASVAFADPVPGSLSGHLLDGADPVPGAQVVVLEASTGGFAGFTSTGAGGEFAVADLPPGGYRVEFRLASGYDQWVHHATDFETAQVITVAEGANTTVEETIAPHGVLAGQVTASTGAPTTAHVTAAQVDGNAFLNVDTDATGAYRLPFVPPGTYTLQFSDATGALRQYAHQRIGTAQPDQFAVTAGATTTVDEQLLAAGAIAGRLTDHGQPVPFAQVILIGDGGTGQPLFTDVDGRYRVQAFPGRYAVEFDLGNGLTQFAHGQRRLDLADRFDVAAGVDTVVDDELLPTGTFTGRLIDAAGAPVPFASVNVTGSGSPLFTSTDADGRWQVRAFTDSYRISFATGQGRQFAHEKTTAATADRFPLGDGQTVTVDERLLPTGTLTVTARNGVTHEPLASFCAFVTNGGGDCTSAGSVSIALLPGSYEVFASPQDDSLLTTTRTGLVVQSGQTTSVTIDLQPAAVITTTVRDARTGAPLAHVCLEAVPTTMPTRLGTGGEVCSDGTGTVRIGSLTADDYNLFAWARDGVHGHQWVGSRGGEGAQAQARTVRLAAGQTVSVPPIRMDLRGTITGIVTDKVTGAPKPGAIVGLSSSTNGFGGTAAEVSTDAAGRYTFDALGPYEWVMIFSGGTTNASEWTGHTANRLRAKGVRVRVGRATTFNLALSQGVTLTGTMFGRDGAPLHQFDARMFVLHADSHDEIASTDTAADGTYTVHVLGRTPVKLSVITTIDEESVRFFHVNAATFEAATTVTMPRAGTATVDLRIPAPA